MNDRPVTYTPPTHRYWKDSSDEIAAVAFVYIGSILGVFLASQTPTEGDLYIVLSKLFATNQDNSVEFGPTIIHEYEAIDNWPAMRFFWPKKVEITWGKDERGSWIIEFELLDGGTYYTIK